MKTSRRENRMSRSTVRMVERIVSATLAQRARDRRRLRPSLAPWGMTGGAL